jgi:hypothetical protein
VFPLTQWVYRGKGMMAVGATYVPPGIDKEGSTTVYAEEGCMVLNPQGQKDRDAIKKGRIGPAPPSVVSNLTRTTAEVVRRMPATPIFGDITGAVAAACGGGTAFSAPTSPRNKEDPATKGTMDPPEGAKMPSPEAPDKEKGSGTQGGVPTVLRLRQVGAEMQANKHIGDLQVQVNQQIADVRREVRVLAEEARNDVRGQLEAANVLTRKELKEIRDEHSIGQKKVGEMEGVQALRHGDILSVLGSMQEMMGAQNRAALGAGPTNPGAAAIGATEAEEQMKREMLMTTRREEGRQKAQKEEEEKGRQREEEKRKGREEDKRKYDETRKEEEKRKIELARMEEEVKRKALLDQAMKKAADELEQQALVQAQDADKLRLQQAQQQAVAESQQQQYQQQVYQQQQLLQQQQNLAAQEQRRQLQQLNQTQALGWPSPTDMHQNNGETGGGPAWSEDMAPNSEF